MRLNAFTVDVEDYFHVAALSRAISRESWPQREYRVERNTEALLEILAERGVHGTFFILGWVAERQAGLVRRIAAAGHEVACHGYGHQRVDALTPEEFRNDVRRSRAILEDAAGVAVRGYRAPTFSVGPHTPWAWRVLEEEGYAYSSSAYPVVRDYYAFAEAPRGPFRPQGAETLMEIPIATVRLGERNWPAGGGGYFRLLPYAISRWALRRINEVDRMPAVFYLHPWELDPGQPRAKGAPLKSNLRHYMNLGATRRRLERLARDFHWDRMDRVFGLDQGEAPIASPQATPA